MPATRSDVKRKTADDGKAVAAGPLSADELRAMDAYWRAANYLSVGQIYLLDNPLLKEPLKREHVKPRLLGHWGPSPPAGTATNSSTRPATAACCRSCT